VCRLADLKETIGKLAAVLVAAPTSKLQAVYAKYSNKKFMKIARYYRYRVEYQKGKYIRYHTTSVGDPDPQDPHVIGPPGSESISQRYGSGSRTGSGSLSTLSTYSNKKFMKIARYYRLWLLGYIYF
jgi:hypothetical protein